MPFPCFQEEEWGYLESECLHCVLLSNVDYICIFYYGKSRQSLSTRHPIRIISILYSSLLQMEELRLWHILIGKRFSCASGKLKGFSLVGLGASSAGGLVWAQVWLTLELLKEELRLIRMVPTAMDTYCSIDIFPADEHDHLPPSWRR